MKALLLSIAILLTGCANLRDTTHLATAVDGATTVIGVTSGVAAEANPLIGNPATFAGILIARVVATEYVNTLAEPQRTTLLSAMSSIWWGAGISNILIIMLAANPVGLTFGALAGLGLWQSTAGRREFAEICMRELQRNPQLTCEWKTS